MKYFIERFKEPSSYAAAGSVIVGVGALISQPIVIAIGVVGGVLGFVLKEKGITRITRNMK
jgi:hypothetical protein|tara:strand:+ start:98 stop:280 length:183 start_codon:yes stop_codon:yes gene_type:complete